jgi:DNA-binding PadR family transcriptional regulator
MPDKEPRLSHAALRVLGIFMTAPRERIAGSDIVKQTGMLSGTLYPILMRLERAGWLDSDWEQLDPVEAGRPRKRLYCLTPNGFNKANAALTELGVPSGRPEWSY